MPVPPPPGLLRDPAARCLLACALPATAYCVWRALLGEWSWLPAAVACVLSVAAIAGLRPGALEDDWIHVDDAGVQPAGAMPGERILWRDVQEIRMVTAADLPAPQASYLALVAPDGKGCMIPERAVVRSQLLDELRTRFPGLDPALARDAMDAEGEHDIVLWKRQPACVD